MYSIIAVYATTFRFYFEAIQETDINNYTLESS